MKLFKRALALCLVLVMSLGVVGVTQPDGAFAPPPANASSTACTGTTGDWDTSWSSVRPTSVWYAQAVLTYWTCEYIFNNDYKYEGWVLTTWGCGGCTPRPVDEFKIRLRAWTQSGGSLYSDNSITLYNDDYHALSASPLWKAGGASPEAIADGYVKELGVFNWTFWQSV